MPEVLGKVVMLTGCGTSVAASDMACGSWIPSPVGDPCVRKGGLLGDSQRYVGPFFPILNGPHGVLGEDRL